MKHRTSALAVALAATMAVSAAGAQAGSTGADATEQPNQAEPSSGGEYVVAFDVANEDAAMQAIAEAGGVVVDVQEQIGLALVETTDAQFTEVVAADESVSGVVQNQSIGASEEGRAQVRATERLTVIEEGMGDAPAAAGQQLRHEASNRRPRTEPLEGLQWDMKMIGATRDGAHRRATGRGVTVGIIDTGVDGSHPDIAPNFDIELSRNFTHDIPLIDGPCDVPTCIDAVDVDEDGHGTHVAGTVAAARNGIGITGVAPDATIVNVRAGQDSGYFFFYETVSALLYAGDAGLDVVNMSFYTDPWLFNCASAADYISGDYTQAEIDEQAMIRTGVIAALEYAHDHGVTMVAAAGNSHTNVALPERFDDTSPDFPPGIERERTVTNNCLDLPSEGPHVLTVGAVGPSTTKADYSSYGLPGVEISAPGGWFRDGFGTPMFRTDANLILSSYPYDVAIEEGYLDEFGAPIGTDAYSSCDPEGNCAAWVYLQGTSMASPHVAGEAALVIDAHGRRRQGLAPDTVAQIILSTATDHVCPDGGVESYADEGRTPDFDAVCDGTTAVNGLYGEGIINATAAVARRRR
jgi:lantibiotic leader peptide-processing serine protease